MIDLAFILYVLFSFFSLLIVAKGTALIIGYKRIIFLGLSIPVLIGGFAVSALTCRLTYLLAEIEQMELNPWISSDVWVKNSQANAELVQIFLKNRPLLSIGLILFSLVMAFLLVGSLTYFSALPALKLQPVYFAIYSFILIDLFTLLSLRFDFIAGGYSGVFVPDLFSFSTVNRDWLLMLISGLIAIIVFSLSGTITKIIDSKRDGFVLFLAGGIMGISGCLLSLRHLFVVQLNFSQMFWGWWPLLMLVLAGFSQGKKLILSLFFVYIIRNLMVIYHTVIIGYIFFPLYSFELIFLSCFMIVGLIVYQKE